MRLLNSKLFFVLGLAVLISCSPPVEQEEDRALPQLIEVNGVTQLHVDGLPFIMLGGELRNSSAFSLDFMEPIWEQVAQQNLNTLLLPLSWRQLEPEEGALDFTMVDGLIDGARGQDLKLVFLWFGAWKNGFSGYAPAWVTGDVERFPRMEYENGKKIEVFSNLSENLKTAEIKAFEALMAHIRDVDSQEQTVIMMQVENEVGIRGSARDYSPMAEARLAEEVPGDLLSYLGQHRESLRPGVFRAWKSMGFPDTGSWQEVFGKGVACDEIFMAWSYAIYMNEVAEAGMEEYSLPMFANIWLFTEGRTPGIYPSGGPVYSMIDIWKAAAPSLVTLAPDIYEPEFKLKCRQFARPDNPLFIPEACAIWYDDTVSGPAKVCYAIGQHNAIGFSPFGIDDPTYHPAHSLAKMYGILSSIMPLITDAQQSGNIQACMEEGNQSDSLVFGDYKFIADYSLLKPDYMEGYALVIREEENKFLIVGNGLKLAVISNNPDLPHLSFLSIEEGCYKEGQWVPGRNLSGDETLGNGTEGLKFPPNPYDIGRVGVNDISIQKVEFHLFR